MMPQISLSLLIALMWPARLLLLPPILSFLVLDAKGGERVCRFRGELYDRDLVLLCGSLLHYALSCLNSRTSIV
jgi:hypothetical protein